MIQQTDPKRLNDRDFKPRRKIMGISVPSKVCRVLFGLSILSEVVCVVWYVLTQVVK